MAIPDGKRVAIVDDDPLFLEQIEVALLREGGLRVVKLNDSKALFDAIENQNISCVVLDQNLGSESGLAVGQALREHVANPPPIIMLTGAGSERTAVKAFRIGFSDYVPKRNLQNRELIGAIRSAIERAEQDQAARQRTKKLLEGERHDSLTGFYADHYIRARLEELTSGRNASPFALIAVRIKDRRTIHARIGHRATEMLFRDLAAHAAKLDIGGGYWGHLGTDTLVSVLEDDPGEDDVADACRLMASRLKFTVSHDGLSIDCEAIVGASLFPQDGHTAETVIDTALAESDRAATLEARWATSFLDPGTEAVANSQLDDSLAVPTSDRRGMDLVPPGGIDRRKSDRRRDQRYRVLRRGRAIVDGLHTVIDCTVRNLSESGAQLRFASYFVPPDRFKLEIVGAGEPRWVQVRWQVGNDVGVQYEDQG